MRSVMTRVIVLVAGLLLTVSLAAEAQQTAKIARIGYLSPAAGPGPLDDVFEQALHALGWTRGQNLRIESRYSAGRPHELNGLAVELVDLGIDVLVVWSPAGGLAAKRATTQIPVVFLSGGGDPVGIGLVSNLARPGGNVTGFSSAAAVETYAKRLELLKELLPSLRRVAVLDAMEPRSTSAKETIRAAAKMLKLELHDVQVKAAADLEAAVAKAKEHGAQALYVWPSGLTSIFADRISQFALANRLPSIHPFTHSAEAGGLLAYSPSFREFAKGGAMYVDKILRGAKPGDLPVEQPRKFDFTVNLKTAKALGVTIPPSLMLRADHVIE